MNGVRSFSGLHFVHLFVLDEEVVPVVPEDIKQVITVQTDNPYSPLLIDGSERAFNSAPFAQEFFQTVQ